MDNWNSAVNKVIEDSAESGEFVGGEMLIRSIDCDEAFRIMADNLNDENLSEWIVNNDRVMSLILSAIKNPKSAEMFLDRARNVLGGDLLEKNREDIEDLAFRNAKQYAMEARWDSRLDDMRDLG